MLVWVGGKACCDLIFEDGYLFIQSPEHGHQAQRDPSSGVALSTDQARCRFGQACVEHLGTDASAVAHRAQPDPQALRGEPASLAYSREPAQKRQADSAVGLGEQSDRSGEGQLQVGSQLVEDLDPGLDQVLARATQCPNGPGPSCVLSQRLPAMPVGAQCVGQHIRVEGVVLVPRGAIAGPQGLDLAARYDEHIHRGVQQLLDYRSVATLDGHLGN